MVSQKEHFFVWGQEPLTPGYPVLGHIHSVASDPKLAVDFKNFKCTRVLEIWEACDAKKPLKKIFSWKKDFFLEKSSYSTKSQFIFEI